MAPVPNARLPLAKDIVYQVAQPSCRDWEIRDCTGDRRVQVLQFRMFVGQFLLVPKCS